MIMSFLIAGFVAGVGFVICICIDSSVRKNPRAYRTLTGPVTITRIEDGEVWFETPGEYGVFAIDDIHPEHRHDLIVGHCFSEFQVVAKSQEPSR